MRARDAAPKGGFALEGMQHDPLEEVPQGEVVVFRQRLQDLEDALLQAHPRLHAFHHQASRSGRGRVCRPRTLGAPARGLRSV